MYFGKPAKDQYDELTWSRPPFTARFVRMNHGEPAYSLQGSELKVDSKLLKADGTLRLDKVQQAVGEPGERKFVNSHWFDGSGPGFYSLVVDLQSEDKNPVVSSFRFYW